MTLDHPNVQRLGLPDEATATSFQFWSVYMFALSKAGAVADAKLPIGAPADFDRISGQPYGRSDVGATPVYNRRATALAAVVIVSCTEPCQPGAMSTNRL